MTDCVELEPCREAFINEFVKDFDASRAYKVAFEKPDISDAEAIQEADLLMKAPDVAKRKIEVLDIRIGELRSEKMFAEINYDMVRARYYGSSREH